MKRSGRRKAGESITGLVLSILGHVAGEVILLFLNHIA